MCTTSRVRIKNMPVEWANPAQEIRDNIKGMIQTHTEKEVGAITTEYGYTYLANDKGETYSYAFVWLTTAENLDDAIKAIDQSQDREEDSEPPTTCVTLHKTKGLMG